MDHSKQIKDAANEYTEALDVMIADPLYKCLKLGYKTQKANLQQHFMAGAAAQRAIDAAICRKTQDDIEEDVGLPIAQSCGYMCAHLIELQDDEYAKECEK